MPDEDLLVIGRHNLNPELNRIIINFSGHLKGQSQQTVYGHLKRREIRA